MACGDLLLETGGELLLETGGALQLERWPCGGESSIAVIPLPVFDPRCQNWPALIELDFRYSDSLVLNAVRCDIEILLEVGGTWGDDVVAPATYVLKDGLRVWRRFQTQQAARDWQVQMYLRTQTVLRDAWEVANDLYPHLLDDLVWVEL